MVAAAGLFFICLFFYDLLYCFLIMFRILAGVDVVKEPGVAASGERETHGPSLKR